MIASVAPLLLLLAPPSPPVPADSPEAAPAPVPEDSPTDAPAPATVPPPPPAAKGQKPIVEPPPMPEREGYVDGEIPTDAPPGSRRGEKREGEVWRPITPPTYTTKQPTPSEQAVIQQSNPELSATLASKKKPIRYDSPQRFALEIKFGPYLPEIDRNYSGTGLGPYANVYGTTDELGVATGQPKKGFYGGIAFEYQIVNLAGPIGIGFQWSMFRDKAQALLAMPPEDPKDGVRSAADSTRFATMPLALQAVYRFELLADRFRVPLVPYAKFGVNYSFWWSKDGSGEISVLKNGDKARGGAWGIQGNFGGMLRLDWLERGEARNLDRITGINHTYIFGEWQFSRVNNFGRKNSINLGDSTWLVGLAIEF